MRTKKELRKQMLAKRAGLFPWQRDEYSKAICQRVIQLPLFKQSQKILFYLSFRSEASLFHAMQYAWRTGKEVIVPRVNEDRQTMSYYRINSFKELIVGTYGILEPKPSADRRVSPEELELLLVPGVAFDRKGYRLGYGGGYYDRFLAKWPHMIPIGIAFSIQLVDSVFPEPHDIPMKAVITENGEILF